MLKSTRLFLILLSLIAINTLFRFQYLSVATYLNEDSALMLGALRSIEKYGLGHWFVNSYGPDIIRPFQLISFWIEAKLFGFEPLPQLVVNIALISLSQLLLILSFLKVLPLFWSILAVLPLSLGRAGAESNYWLSARHDLFLLLFGAIALLIVVQKTRTFFSLHNFSVMAVLTILFLGAFLSNEKGLVVPPLIVIFSFYLYGSISKAILSPLVAATIAYLFYFPYRYLVLEGEYIGGYEGKFLPDNLSILGIFEWLFGLCLTPLRIGGEVAPLMIPGILLILLLMGLRRGDLSVLAKGTFIGGIALVISGLPTIRYAPAPLTDHIFNSRMLWLPLLVSSFFYAAIFRRVFSGHANYLKKKVRLLLLAAYLLALSFQSYQSTSDFAAASHFTRNIAVEYKQVCPCIGHQESQVVGIPEHWRTVNVFTSYEWLFRHLQVAGIESCNLPCSALVRRVKRRLDSLEFVGLASPVSFNPDQDSVECAPDPGELRVELQRTPKTFGPIWIYYIEEDSPFLSEIEDNQLFYLLYGEQWYVFRFTVDPSSTNRMAFFAIERGRALLKEGLTLYIPNVRCYRLIEARN